MRRLCSAACFAGIVRGPAPPPEAGPASTINHNPRVSARGRSPGIWRAETSGWREPAFPLRTTQHVWSCVWFHYLLFTWREDATADMLDYSTDEVQKVSRCCNDALRCVIGGRWVWMDGTESQGRGLEEGLNGDWWRQRVWELNLANGSAGVELILFALELSGLRIRELCLYARHLLSIMMSRSRTYHVPRWGWMSWQDSCCINEAVLLKCWNYSLVSMTFYRFLQAVTVIIV